MQTDLIAPEITVDDAASRLSGRSTPPMEVIEPRHGWIKINWREIWRYRELLFFLTWRDVKIRYKQTVLGAAWAILQPFLTTVVFTVFFGRLAGMEGRTGGVPYPIFVFAGLLPWQFFANSVTNSSNSLITSTNLISKVYFPRLIIPFSAAGTGLVDFGVSSLMLVVMMLYYGVSLTAQILLLPLLLLGLIGTATGVGAMLSALTVSYRDFRYVVPFMVQIWMYLTPVIYPVTLIPDGWRWLLYMNPIAGLIDGFRDVILGRPMDWSNIGLSLAMSAVVFVGGTMYFRRAERRFADII